ncbi:MAG: beta-galactosidase [Anaerolineae bacterium]|nr:beta-galactosidase [Anaerolineae bacterium]
MSRIRIADGKVYAGDTAISLLSGELHYWRLAPESWRDCLLRIKEMGLQLIASYVCWDFHEIAPGEYDFEGRTDPRRNLIAFLELVAAENLWLIIRPGPYIYSEWSNGGVPDHAAVYHRLHPEFQQQAQVYMQAVVKVLKPYLATNGGRILLFQSDNEIDPWSHWHTEALGLGSTAGVFQQFLKDRYSTIDTLNEVWRSNHHDFESVHATMSLIDQTLEHLLPFLDYCRFRHDYVKQVARWGVETYKRLGVDVPMLLNTYSGVTTQPAADLEQIADLVGADLYPSRDFALRAEEHRYFLDSLRYLSAYSRLPYIAEFEAGIWHDWLNDVGWLPPNHYRLICLSALLTGVLGWNWYMIVNRDNWVMSPINEWGRKRPELFDVFQQITALFQQIDPPSLKVQQVSALTLDPLQRAAVRPAQDLLRAFYESGINYAIYDPTVGECALPLLFYAGTYWLSASAQQKLAAYVEHGGHLILLGGVYPRYDDTLRPLNLLQIAEPTGIVDGLPQGLQLNVELSAGQSATLKSAWLAQYAASTGKPITAQRLAMRGISSEEEQLRSDLQVGAKYTIGYTERRGQGQITVLGLPPTRDLIHMLHHVFAPAPLRCLTPDAAVGLLHGKANDYLIVINNGEEARAIELQFSPVEAAYQAQDLISGKRLEVHAGTMFVPVPRKDGTVIRLKSEQTP